MGNDFLAQLLGFLKWLDEEEDIALVKVDYDSDTYIDLDGLEIRGLFAKYLDKNRMTPILE